jgi:hypothetical protein
MIAVHFENLVFLLFILGALLFQLLTRAVGTASKDSDEDDETEPEPQSRPRPMSDQERIREFLEALGQPPTATPPSPVARRSEVPPPVTAAPRPTYQKPVVLPHVPSLASPVPPLTTRPPDLPREMRLPGQIPRQAKAFIPKAPEPLRFEVHEHETLLATAKSAAEAYASATQPAVAPQQPQTHFAALLRSTSSLRDAIVLREIFGPPRSAQPLELTNII